MAGAEAASSVLYTEDLSLFNQFQNNGHRWYALSMFKGHYEVHPREEAIIQAMREHWGMGQACGESEIGEISVLGSALLRSLHLGIFERLFGECKTTTLTIMPDDMSDIDEGPFSFSLFSSPCFCLADIPTNCQVYRLIF